MKRKRRKLWAVRAWIFSNRKGLFPNCVYRFEKVFFNQTLARKVYHAQIKKLTGYYGTSYHGRTEFFNPHISDDGTVEKYPDKVYLDVRSL